MKVTLKNDFHNSDATVLVKNGKVSYAAMGRAFKKLCGVSGCYCGGMRGTQDYEVRDLYNGFYSVTAR